MLIKSDFSGSEQSAERAPRLQNNANSKTSFIKCFQTHSKNTFRRIESISLERFVKRESSIDSQE